MKKVLIAVDVVNDFVDGALGTKEAAAIIPNVIAKIKKYEKEGWEIIFLRDTHFENYMRTTEGKNLPVPHTIMGTRGWLVADKIREKIDTDKYLNLEKNTFGCTALIDHLKGLQNEFEAELIGICTGICVISNALLLKAYFPEIKITVDADCCACVTPKNHSEALNIMKLCHINIENNWQEVQKGEDK